MKRRLLITTWAFLGVSLVQGPYAKNQLLQHLPTVLALLLLSFEARRNWITPAAFACVIVFWWLHILGARYIYSYVPYDAWTTRLLGTSVSEWAGWERNHYDRLVHFAFGLLWALPIAEISRKFGGTGPKWVLISAASGVLMFSALYEVFEWLLTVFMSADDAEAYNGQQGDFWDAQKDMALAGMGSLVTIAWLACGLLRGRPPVNSPVSS